MKREQLGKALVGELIVDDTQRKARLRCESGTLYENWHIKEKGSLRPEQTQKCFFVWGSPRRVMSFNGGNAPELTNVRRLAVHSCAFIERR